VAGGIERTERTHPTKLTLLGQRLSIEIAQLKNVRVETNAGHVPPFMHARQALSGECGVGRRLIPADAADRQADASFGMRAELPGGRTRPPSGVAKLRHRFPP